MPVRSSERDLAREGGVAGSRSNNNNAPAKVHGVLLKAELQIEFGNTTGCFTLGIEMFDETPIYGMSEAIKMMVLGGIGITFGTLTHMKASSSREVAHPLENGECIWTIQNIFFGADARAKFHGHGGTLSGAAPASHHAGDHLVALFGADASAKFDGHRGSTPGRGHPAERVPGDLIPRRMLLQRTRRHAEARCAGGAPGAADQPDSSADVALEDEEPSGGKACGGEDKRVYQNILQRTGIFPDLNN